MIASQMSKYKYRGWNAQRVNLKPCEPDDDEEEPILEN